MLIEHFQHLVIAGAIPGNEIEHPMAIVMTGGMITSTLLSLFVTPAVYLRFGDRKKQSAVPVLAPALSF